MTHPDLTVQDTIAELTPVPVFQIGRKRALHLARVLIEGTPARVVVRTSCGLLHTDEFTHTIGIPTCDSCMNADPEPIDYFSGFGGSTQGLRA